MPFSHGFRDDTQVLLAAKQLSHRATAPSPSSLSLYLSPSFSLFASAFLLILFVDTLFFLTLPAYVCSSLIYFSLSPLFLTFVLFLCSIIKERKSFFFFSLFCSYSHFFSSCYPVNVSIFRLNFSIQTSVFPCFPQFYFISLACTVCAVYMCLCTHVWVCVLIHMQTEAREGQWMSFSIATLLPCDKVSHGTCVVPET